MKYFLLFLFLFVVGCVLSQDSDKVEEGISSDSTIIPETVIIRKISFNGLKITKEKIVRREILFKEGDTISNSQISELLKQSSKNLINTSLFNFVSYDSIPIKTTFNQIDINFEFQERWYVWPVPIFELADRNFNEWLKKRDLSRLNYGLFLTWNNFRGRREKLVVYSRFGYDERYQISYQVPYVNKKQTIGMGFAGGFAQNHEIAYSSEDNVEVYYKNESKHAKRDYYFYTEAYYRKGIHNVNWIKLGYNHLQVEDSVLYYNPDYTFDTANVNEYLAFFYQYRSDYRDYKQYPLKGRYFDAELEKKGLGIVSATGVNTLSIKSNFRKYFKLRDRFYFATGATGKVSPIWDQPYYYQRGLGYGREYVRGYEYYVIDGQHYGLLKSNLKFELVPMRVTTFNFIPTPKFNKLYYAFYLNIFADFGYVWDDRNYVFNPLANEILVGYGIGLDFVTYYDFVVRFEYSFNKMGESGFFISFMPPI